MSYNLNRGLTILCIYVPANFLEEKTLHPRDQKLMGKNSCLKVGSDWNPEPGKCKGKKIMRKNRRKIKNKFKLNTLILYVLFKLILFGSLYHVRTKFFLKYIKF